MGAGGSDFSSSALTGSRGQPDKEFSRHRQYLFILQRHCTVSTNYFMVAECWEEGEEYVVMQHNVLEMWSFWSNSLQLFNGGQLGK